MAFRLSIFAAALALAASGVARADKAPFDLVGPSLDITVSRGAAALPISAVPDLAPGDKLHIKAELPPRQGAHYLLVTAFLRGATDPPPKNWFFVARTWEKGGKGLELTVPAGAQQALVFLAPQTGGDFSTLLGTVRSRPGAFVRAAQDLEQLDLDRARLQAFLDSVRETDRTDPNDLQAVSTRLARSLGIKLDESCFARTANLQASCLMKDQDALVLDDGHTSSLVHSLTGGDTGQLISQLGYAPLAGGGLYSPYVGAVVDIVRILDGIRTAHYQYIPALALASGARLDLHLNTPPSFADPKSVLVVALPPVAPTAPPPLRALDPLASYCLAKKDVVLPVEGAPLVFATDFAHDMTLRVKARSGETLDVPLHADAARGGFVAEGSGIDPSQFEKSVTGELHGNWGFSGFDGPNFRLEAAGGGVWRVADDDADALVVGRTDTLHLVGGPADCVESLKLEASGADEPLSFKVASAETLMVTAPLATTPPGDATVVVDSAGGKPQRVSVKAYAQAGRLDRFVYHAGDKSGVLEGARLDEVSGLTLAGAHFSPGPLQASGGLDSLELDAKDPLPAQLAKPGVKLAARVTLVDGRTEKLETQVLTDRPQIVISALTLKNKPDSGVAAFELGDPGEFARGAVLAFSIAAPAPASFTPHDTAEASTADGAWSTRLQGPDEFVLADSHAAVATLDTAKAFGPSAWGPVRVRIDDDKGDSDWQPLGTLVRLPKIDGVVCSHEGSACRLEGDDLFLIAAVSASSKFEDPVTVPNGFPGASIEVPHPHDGRLYVKLHDDPAVVSVMRVRPGGVAVAKRRPASGGASGTTPEPAPTASGPAQPPLPNPGAASDPAQSPSPNPGAMSGPAQPPSSNPAAASDPPQSSSPNPGAASGAAQSSSPNPGVPPGSSP
ncbi:MAG TPA: hypothetical protein VH353_03035 [Caulobacteraceae bacterium]|jgi:hypothetical protein|nr:hypothetical protein [Caulobacteraceae bacterium]